MPEWLEAVHDGSQPVVWDDLAVRLGLALVLGAAVAAIYRATRCAASVTPTFPATLVLLAVLIAMVTQVIGDNVARAFSLVGALSIVRFRTSVRDTKDTAFVIFSVVVGMAVGARQPAVALAGIVVVGAAAALFRDRPGSATWNGGDILVTIRCGWAPDLEAAVLRTLSSFASSVVPVSVSTTRHGAAVELTYRLRLSSPSAGTQLLAELNRLEGIQSVELRNQREEL